ncbi:Type 1 glutamine amidotransferase-like domain-containing protein [Dactylosporangium sp. NPDC050588]|uniref:Type 1 glutamine amidotransferase-like domain-containing protein n=1 Tax=Dactylosporangium sp. NPDC050588 TaxID=3157211 RepID=UPI0033C14B4E
MSSVYLLGGGWDPAALPAMYGEFAAQVRARGGRLAYVLQSGTPGTRFVDVFTQLGLTSVRRVTISARRSVAQRELRHADGIFVCGGSNPLYQSAFNDVAAEARQLVMADGVPYAGFSAGAVIAADRALLGGWRRRLPGLEVPVCAERRNEGIETIAAADGLGLVPFTVDVHGTQWGTVSRTLHAIHEGLVDDCYLVDENTALTVRQGCATVSGLNSVYRVWRTDAGIHANVFPPGSRFEVLSGSGL